MAGPHEEKNLLTIVDRYLFVESVFNYQLLTVTVCYFCFFSCTT